MKKIVFLLAKLVSLSAFFLAITSVGTTCMFEYHQPIIPDEVWKLRK